MSQSRREFLQSLAAAVLPSCTEPPPAERWSTTINAACFTPQSYFDRVLDLDSYIELKCFGLIMSETIGSKDRKPARIEDDKFTNLLNESHPSVSRSLKKLEASGMIAISEDKHRFTAPVRRSGRKTSVDPITGHRYAEPEQYDYDDIPLPGGHATYAIAEEYAFESRNAGKEKPKGKCPHCKTVSQFETRFVPIPHIAFRRLGACVDEGTFRVVMAIASRTLAWNAKAKCIDVVPATIDGSELERMTGLADRQITECINRAGKLGIIGRQRIAGKPSLFWAIPEKFGSLEKRDRRTVEQPVGAGKAKPETEKKAKTPTNPQPTPAVESHNRYFGRCTNCDHFVDFEPVSEEEFADAQPPAVSKYPPKSNSSPPKMSPAAEKRLQSRTLVSKLAEMMGEARKKMG